MSTTDEEIVVAHFIVSDDVERSRRFYTEVLGGKTVISGESNDEVTYVALANSWIVINVGGGPTDHKPTVTLETPPDPDRVSSFLNIRVADIQAVYAEWSARGAQFLTPPKQLASSSPTCQRAECPLHTLEVAGSIPAAPIRTPHDELISLNHPVRLVTLTGPGGSGKTRLALQAAAHAPEEYPDGVWWVPLAALRDPALVLETAAQVLGARRELAAHIGDRSLLLLFDNFEHLTEAATDLAGLVADCGRLTVLVTSREPLHLGGEWEYAVDPLRETEAVEMFCQRALAVNRDFSADGEVHQICLRLDCLPLAIELAAAHVKVLAPAAILARLGERLPLLVGGARDAPERQRTLHATIEWSYELLSSQEQRLFTHLGVFVGGCTLEAAEHVCDADIDTLRSLIDKSLIRRTGERYWMLETIREYAANRLEESGERETLARRHAEHYLVLVETLEPDLAGPRRADLLTRLEADHDNLRAALGWYALSDARRLVRFANAAFQLWWAHSHLVEGDRWFTLALAESPDEASPTRAQALNYASGFASFLGDQPRSRDLGERAVAEYRQLGDQRGLCIALRGLAGSALAVANYDEAAAWAEESLQLARQLGDDLLTEMALTCLGEALGGQGRLAEAIDLCQQGHRGFKARGMVDYATWGECQLGYFDLAQANLANARTHFKTALRDSIEYGLKTCVADCLLGLGAIATAQGDLLAAAKLLAAGERLAAETGYILEPQYKTPLDQSRAAISARLSPVEIEETASEAAAMTLEQITDYALQVVE